MHIYIKSKESIGFHIPVPLCLADFGINIAIFALKHSDKYIDDEARKYIDCFDFEALKKSIKYLKGYKGLKLVDITSSTGEVIRITV